MSSKVEIAFYPRYTEVMVVDKTGVVRASRKVAKHDSAVKRAKGWSDVMVGSSVRKMQNKPNTSNAYYKNVDSQTARAMYIWCTSK